MKKMKVFFTAMVLLAAGIQALAQNITVSGKVVDPSGNPVVGASIVLQSNNTVYTMSDVSGAYKLNVPSNGVLLVNCLGYQDQTVDVNGRKAIDIILQEDTEVLDDVIVVAYGTVRREANTGSVVTMDKVGLAEAPVSSVDKLLGGKMAGVQVTTQTGQPGASSEIRIRGISSLNAGSSPLWVVDGIPVESGDQSYFTNTSNAMSAINPSDIENITVLKDAAAASIYGSRAANGVILVTTKSGKSGRAKFTARAKFGASQLANDNHYRVMTGSELVNWQRVAITNAGYNPDDPTSPYYSPKSLLTAPLTNWMKEFTRLGKLEEYEINAAGGNDRGKFYSSLSYQKNEGITYGTDFTKFTARVNSDYKLTNTIEMGTRVNIGYNMSNDTPMQSLYYSNPFFAGMTILPWTPFYDEEGNYNVNISENSNTNPLYTATHDDQWEKQYRAHATAFLQWQPIKNLVLKTNNSVETTFGEGRRYWAPDPGDSNGTLQTSTTQFVTLTTSNTATYNISKGGNNFRLMAGQEAMRRSYNYYYMYGPTVSAKIPYMTTAVSSEDQTGYSANYRTLLSYFGMLDYNFNNTYYLTASIREDGSSLFGSENQWGTFWSVGGSWNVTNEKFLRHSKRISLLKLRASYGVNGNNNISPYQAYGVYSTSAYNGANGSLPSSPDNSSLSWEKNKTWNLGMDLSFYDGRLNAQFDVYDRTTTDMLLSKSVPQTSGFSSNFMNIGSLGNKGVEYQMDGDIFHSADLVWNVGFNISYNKSTVIDLGDDDFMTYSGDSRIRHKVGERFYTFYLKDYYGVNPVNGEALWRHHEYTYEKDADGNDIEDKILTDTVTLTNSYNEASYIYAGSPEPILTGGFNTNISYKGLNLSAFFEYKWGNKVLIIENRYVNSDGSQMSMNQNSLSLNYWEKPGDTGVYPKPVAGNSSNSYAMPSTRWLEDGSYLRIKDVTLSYNLPEKTLKTVKLSAVKVYVSALNLFTFHNVHFWDPERGLDGMGYGIYPVTKSFVGGIEVSF